MGKSAGAAATVNAAAVAAEVAAAEEEMEDEVGGKAPRVDNEVGLNNSDLSGGE